MHVVRRSRRRGVPLCTVAGVVGFLLLFAVSARAQQGGDNRADTWVATDALGRTLPDATTCPPPRSDRFVGIFYFVWHGGHGTPGPYDITKLIAENPDAPAYGPKGAFHWWGEPEAGYYRATDPWVVRRNIAMLADAGVDVLLVDVTNAFTYPDEITLLLETLTAMRAEGNRTPQIAFVTHSRTVDTVERLWNEVYAKNRFPELWFCWKNKPLLLGDENAKEPDGKTIPENIRSFFTWRYSWAWDPGVGKWQWIDRTPQRPGFSPEKPTGQPEELPVAVASHPMNGIGRSYRAGHEPPLDRDKVALAWQEGRQFNEQLTRLYEVDPQFAFITGWNEWVAQRFTIAPKQRMNFLGEGNLPEGATFFVDAFNREFSRDLEPMRGGATDSYYYQLVAGIRRFKGVRPLPVASAPQTIHVEREDPKQWERVGPEYRDTVGDTLHRDAPGWGDLHYKDESGRNDLVRAKVARDADTVYFLAETRAPLTPPTGPDWMVLLLDTDRNARTGWLGYDFRLNAHPEPAKGTTTLERWNAARTAWEPVARIPFHAAGNRLQIAVPRRLLGIPIGASVPFSFDFHWCDNARTGTADPQTDFLMRGDHAPNRRFNYRYVAP